MPVSPEFLPTIRTARQLGPRPRLRGVKARRPESDRGPTQGALFAGGPNDGGLQIGKLQRRFLRMRSPAGCWLQLISSIREAQMFPVRTYRTV